MVFLTVMGAVLIGLMVAAPLVLGLDWLVRKINSALWYTISAGLFVSAYIALIIQIAVWLRIFP